MSEHEHVNDESEASASTPDLDALQARVDALRDEIAEADRRLRIFVRHRPFVALGAAVAAGFVIGRILRRL